MPGINEKLRAPPDFDGPIKDRKCTDIPFTLLIIALWVAMTIVGITSIQEVSSHFVNKLPAMTSIEQCLRVPCSTGALHLWNTQQASMLCPDLVGSKLEPV